MQDYDPNVVYWLEALCGLGALLMVLALLLAAWTHAVM